MSVAGRGHFRLVRGVKTSRADETWPGYGIWAFAGPGQSAELVSQVQQMRDLLECAWPAVLDAARQPQRAARAGRRPVSACARLGRWLWEGGLVWLTLLRNVGVRRRRS